MNIFSKIGIGAGLTTSAILAYDDYSKEKTAIYGLNANMLLAGRNMERLDEFPFLIDILFKKANKYPKKNIITLQEIPNFNKIFEYLEQKAEENNYYIFSIPYGPRTKLNSQEKFTRLIVMLDKDRFKNCKSAIWNDFDQKGLCDDVLGVAATDILTNEEWLIESIHTNTSTQSRKEFCNRFGDKINYFEKKFDIKFTKKYSAGDFNKFSTYAIGCTDLYYSQHIQRGMVSALTPYYYNPYENAIHEISKKECNNSFFPEWSDMIIYIISKSLEELKKFGITISPYDLSYFGQINSKFIKLNAETERDFSMRGKVRYSKIITDLDKVIKETDIDKNINKVTKQLFVNILTKIKDNDPNKDLNLNDIEYNLFIALNAIQQMNFWFTMTEKLDMANISSNKKLLTKTIIFDQRIEIDKLLACHDEETKKKLKNKIILRNKLFRYMPRPNGLEWLDDDEMLEKYTLFSDHFANKTKIKEASIINKLTKLVRTKMAFNTKN